MILIADTPSGKGTVVKIAYKHKVKHVRVKLTKETIHFNKRGKKIIKRKQYTKDFPYADCTIHKADSRFMKWLKKFFKRNR
jgi:hypothetical protein